MHLIGARRADCLILRKCLIGICKYFKARSGRLSHGADTSSILVDRAANLQLASPKAFCLCLERVLDQRLLVQMEPPALGRVEGNRILRASGELVQGKAELARLEIP